jgi:FkbM family methyltransferase
VGVKKQLVNLIHEGLKRPPLEVLVSEAYRRLPRRARPYVRKLAPQPYSYAANELRCTSRGGLKWELYPRAHFQWLQYFGFEDPVLDVLVAIARRSSMIVDVGANVGFYSLSMAKAAGPKAMVHAFEPNPDTFALLSRHREINSAHNVELHGLALGARSEDRVLYAGRDSGKFSLEPEGRSLEGAKDVKVTTMDGLWRERQLPKVDLLKIDVEGHEPAVLMGGRHTIERDAPFICFELTPSWYGKEDLDAEGAFRWLASLPYTFFGIASPEVDVPRLVPVDLLEAFAGRHGSGQLNILGIPTGRGPVSEIMNDVNTVRHDELRLRR